MVGRVRGQCRGNQPQQIELAEMRRMIEDLAQAIQALQRQEPVKARMENPEGDYKQLKIPENLEVEEEEEVEDVNPFHEAGPANQAARGGLEGRLLHALDLNGGGIKIESSWTKQAVEVDSPWPVSPWDQVAECPDSTCAQVIHSNAEISGNKQAPGITGKEREQKEEQLGIQENLCIMALHELFLNFLVAQVLFFFFYALFAFLLLVSNMWWAIFYLSDNAIGKEPKKVVPENLDLQIEYQVEDPIKLVGAKQKNLLERGSGKFKEQIDKAQLDLNSESPSNQLKYEAVNLIGFPTNTADPLMDSTEFEASKHSKILDVKNKAPTDAKETPPLELCLKRLRGVQDVGTAVVEDRNVLRRSDSSAFSRYNAASNANKAPCANIRSGSPHDCSLDITKKGSVYDLQSHSNGDHPNQCSNAGSNNIDMGSTTNHTFTESAVLKNKSAGSSTIKYLHPPGFQPVKGDPLCNTQQILSEKADDIAGTMMLSQPRGTIQELQIHHLTNHCDHHHLLHNMQPQQQLTPPNHDDSSLKKMAEAVPHCGSSNMLGGPVEGNGGNYSINRSASGSNHGSNGQNGSSTAVNAGGTNVESDNGIAGKTGSRDGSGSGSRDGNRTDQSKFSQREAALTKFRQKRKERCFWKKVRYQSRKRFAEQRPLARGQFVRQTANESTSRAAES